MRLAALLLLGCASVQVRAPATPYVTESLVWPRSPDWAVSSDRNVLKEIACHNVGAGSKSEWFDVFCDGFKEPDARIWVESNSTTRFLHDVAGRYQVGEACTCEPVK